MLTALMPLKNYHPGFLAEAVGSLFGQDDPRWRLLVIVEAGDAERFREILARELRDPRVALIANEGRGLAGALNTGMRHAATDFVAILLADDMWSADAVGVLAACIEHHPEVDFFHSARRIIDESGRPRSSVHASRALFTRADFVWTSPVKHLLCWRRELALAIGGIDESLPPVGPDDYDFPWCMAEAGAVFRAVAECLYIYRDHREGFRLTTHLPLDVHKAGIRRILEKHRVDPALIARRLAEAEQSYLRQCLFLSREDKAAKERAGLDPRTGWRDTYR
jgi:glycosyltransferase involved in cell wall biosynthesis